MVLELYLIVGRDGSVAVRRRPPTAGRNTVVVPLRLDIPNSVFVPPMLPSVSVVVPEAHVVGVQVETFAPADAAQEG